MAGLLTVQQVAERWTVSARLVQQLAVSRQLRGLKVGRVWRFSETDVLAFESRNTSAPVASAAPALTAVPDSYAAVYRELWDEAAASPAAGRTRGADTKKRRSAVN